MAKPYKIFYKLVFQPQQYGDYEICVFDTMGEAKEFRQNHIEYCSPIRTVCAYSKERVKLLEQQVKKGKKQCLR